MQKINEIQEIASTAYKLLQEEGNKKINEKNYKIFSWDQKNRKNIKIGLSLFKKDDNKEWKLKIQNMNDNNDKKNKIEKNINFLKILNPKNIDIFIQNFPNFWKVIKYQYFQIQNWLILSIIIIIIY